MKKRYVLLLVTLAALLGGVVAQPAANAASALLNVVVTNDNAHPVPVKQQGTVNVQQQGTADVRVTNPSVGPRNRVLGDEHIVTEGAGFTGLIDTRGASSVRIFTGFELGNAKRVCVQLYNSDGTELQSGGTEFCHDGIGTFVVHDVLAPKIRVVIDYAFSLDVRVTVVGLTD